MATNYLMLEPEGPLEATRAELLAVIDALIAVEDRAEIARLAHGDERQVRNMARAFVTLIRQHGNRVR
jgi:hypothetical protein